jgi:hypothetical protein
MAAHGPTLRIPNRYTLFPSPSLTCGPHCQATSSPSSSSRNSSARSPRAIYSPWLNPDDFGHEDLPRLLLLNPQTPLSHSPLFPPSETPPGRCKSSPEPKASAAISACYQWNISEPLALSLTPCFISCPGAPPRHHCLPTRIQERGAHVRPQDPEPRWISGELFQQAPAAPDPTSLPPGPRRRATHRGELPSHSLHLYLWERACRPCRRRAPARFR